MRNKLRGKETILNYKYNKKAQKLHKKAMYIIYSTLQYLHMICMLCKSLYLTSMSLRHQIYTYNEDGPTIEHDHFMDRVDWNGSKRSSDIQDASIYLLNVTFNDTGTYRCFFNRILFYANYEYNTVVSKVVHLSVVAKGTMKSTAFVFKFSNSAWKVPPVVVWAITFQSILYAFTLFWY